jgi:hypothetical protein
MVYSCSCFNKTDAYPKPTIASNLVLPEQIQAVISEALNQTNGTVNNLSQNIKNAVTNITSKYAASIETSSGCAYVAISKPLRP